MRPFPDLISHLAIRFRHWNALEERDGGEEGGGGPFYADRVRPDGILTLQGQIIFQGKI